jgi:hypothetical protein
VSGCEDAETAGSRYPSNQALKQESYSRLSGVHCSERLDAIMGWFGSEVVG